MINKIYFALIALLNIFKLSSLGIQTETRPPGGVKS